MSVDKKREDSLESPLSCCAPKELKANLCETRLLPGRRSARRGRSRRLRCAQVARGGRLGDLVDHQLQSCACPAGVEEDWFVHRAILLLEAVVICQDVDRITVLLGVGVLQFDLDCADLRGTALALHGELEVIALAHAAELIDFIMVPRDERAHLAARHLNAVLGGVQVALHADEIALSEIELVSDNLHVALQLLVDLVSLRQSLGQRLVGLLHGSLCRLLDVPGLIQCAPAYSQAEERNSAQYPDCQADPTGCPCGVRNG